MKVKAVKIRRPKKWKAGLHLCHAIVPVSWTREQAEERARVDIETMIKAQRRIGVGG